MSETEEMPAEVIGWRLFALEDGRLVSPFQRDKWPDLGTRTGWDAGVNRAECLRSLHEAPAVDCTCGYRATEDFGHLVELLSGLVFQDDGASVLEVCGVLARVRLWGSVREGAFDDPATTWRASHAELLEVHLAPFLEAEASVVGARYGVPVAIYDVHEWPITTEPVDLEASRREVSEEGFRLAMGGLTFGTAGALGELLRLSEELQAARDVIDALVETAHGAADSMASDVPAPDIARALWDSPMAPSMAEATAFVEAVVEHLYAFDPATVKRAQMFTRPPSMMDELNRNLKVQLSGIARIARAAG
jgi:hypothetical protein